MIYSMYMNYDFIHKNILLYTCILLSLSKKWKFYKKGDIFLFEQDEKRIPVLKEFVFCNEKYESNLV